MFSNLLFTVSSVLLSESVEMTCNDSNAEVGSSLQNSITLVCSENGTFISHSSFDEVKIDSLKKILIRRAIERSRTSRKLNFLSSLGF